MSMRNILVHDYYKIKESQIRYVIEDDLGPLLEQVKRYLSETNWAEWEQNEQAKAESAVHKSLMQTAWRMKSKGYEVKEIMSITGLTAEEIEAL
jgi:hypothetical protein